MSVNFAPIVTPSGCFVHPASGLFTVEICCTSGVVTDHKLLISGCGGWLSPEIVTGSGPCIVIQRPFFTSCSGQITFYYKGGCSNGCSGKGKTKIFPCP